MVRLSPSALSAHPCPAQSFQAKGPSLKSDADSSEAPRPPLNRKKGCDLYGLF
jgi:hypothetical protein